MAEFSKQYCQLNDMGFDGDFDVYYEWSKLEPNNGIPYICEGFGFTMIARKENDNNVWVLVENEFVDFDEMYLEAKLQTP
jgi:hypothetical protein